MQCAPPTTKVSRFEASAQIALTAAQWEHPDLLIDQALLATLGRMFEVIACREVDRDGSVEETVIHAFHGAEDAIDAARGELESYVDAEHRWWIVRAPGAEVAEWIADSTSRREFVVDLTTGELVELV